MALSALNLGLNWSWYESAEEADGGCAARPTSVEQAEEILSDAAVFCATHVIILLGTAVHNTPSIHPYDYLLWGMRGVALILFASSALRFVRYLGEV